ncbi:hypothetical protein, partial [Streptomyces sp. NPDC002685]|uniref:hypothetical protein n=1 Tax=Streptomyces sp. NPDC002685 TaxID=3154540 RepID=UPI003318D2E3
MTVESTHDGTLGAPFDGAFDGTLGLLYDGAFDMAPGGGVFGATRDRVLVQTFGDALGGPGGGMLDGPLGGAFAWINGSVFGVPLRVRADGALGRTLDGVFSR